MLGFKSREEKLTERLTQLKEGKLATAGLTRKLSPSELEKFKKDFPDLTFLTVYTFKSPYGKKYEVQITRPSKD